MNTPGLLGRVNFSSAGSLRLSNLMLEEMLDKWRRGARGPLPQLTTVQLLNALVVIDEQGPVARRALARALRIHLPTRRLPSDHHVKTLVFQNSSIHLKMTS